MITNVGRCICIVVAAAGLGACSLMPVRIEAPKEPIRIEGTIVIKHEYVLPEISRGALVETASTRGAL